MTIARSPREQLDGLLSHRVLVMDGDTEFALHGSGLSEAEYRGDRFGTHRQDLRTLNDVLNLTQPERVAAAHRSFLEAGADIIRTVTFNANAIALPEYGLAGHDYELNRVAARLARGEADAVSRGTPERPRFVAGTVGPTNRLLSMPVHTEDPGSRDVTFDQLVAAYTPQVTGLIDGGVDILSAWQVYDTLNLKALLFAVDRLCERKGIRLPGMVSAAVFDSGRMLSGQTLEAFWISISGFDLLSVGLGHGGDLAASRSLGERLSRVAHVYISLCPDAAENFPYRYGQPVCPPGHVAAGLRGLATDGFANIIGGSWYATPDHTRAAVEAVRGVVPRRRPARSRSTCLSGLEPLVFGQAGR